MVDVGILIELSFDLGELCLFVHSQQVVGVTRSEEAEGLPEEAESAKHFTIKYCCPMLYTHLPS